MVWGYMVRGEGKMVIFMGAQIILYVSKLLGLKDLTLKKKEMNFMVENIIKQIRQSLTGDQKVDMQILMQNSQEYKNHKYSKEIVREIGRMMADAMGEEFLDRWQNVIDDDLENWNEGILKIKEYINRKDYDLAEHFILDLLKYYKDLFQDDSLNEYVYFDNVFEDLLYTCVRKDLSKKLRPCTYDYPGLYFLYAYIFVEKGDYKRAEKMIFEGLKWNPVSLELLFELSEIYKITKNWEVFLDTIKTCHRLSYTPEKLGRCFRGYGFYFS